MSDTKCKHGHLYQLVKVRNKDVYKCQECPSYIVPALIVGSLARCNVCFEPFKMTLALRGPRTNRMKKKPHCGCMNKKWDRKITPSAIKTGTMRLGNLDDLLKDIAQDEKVVKVR